MPTFPPGTHSVMQSMVPRSTFVGEPNPGGTPPIAALPGTVMSMSQKRQGPDTSTSRDDAITIKKAKKAQHNAKCPTHAQFANDPQLSRVLQCAADKLQVYFATVNPYLSKNDGNKVIDAMYAAAVSEEHVLDGAYPLTSEYILLVSNLVLSYHTYSLNAP